jgi:hypothetical protein
VAAKGGRRHVVEDHLEQSARVEDVLVRESSRTLGAARVDRAQDRSVLVHVLLVEIVDGPPGSQRLRNVRRAFFSTRSTNGTAAAS